MIITRTPYRLSFFGGGTDYNPWFEQNGGLVIGAAMSKYCWISLRKLPPFFEHKTRFAYSKNEEVLNNCDIKHPGAKACLEYLEIADGLEIHHDGDLPARSGIGSSSAFTVGFLQALYTLKNRMVSKNQLARDAIFVEQKLEKQNVGIQDQIFASYGGLQVIEMGPGPTFRVNPLIMSSEYKNYLKTHVLLAFSGFTRFASDSAKDQIKSIENGDNQRQLHEIYDIAKEGLSLFTEQANMERVGQLFHKTWMIKRTLTSDISNSDLDSMYERALAAGAFGGRLLGAGQGGFFMFLAPPEKHTAIKEALKDVQVWVPFDFDEEGAKIITYEPGTNSKLWS